MGNKSDFLPRTDLACERKRADSDDCVTEYSVEGLKITEMLCDEGIYLTVHTPVMRYLDLYDKERITEVLSGIIRKMVCDASKKEKIEDVRVLIAGLGNRFISADAIGPETADKISVTGHLKGFGISPESLGISNIYAVSPGVMGQTGIDSATIIKGAAEHITPDVIIAVDALAARKAERLGATVQLTNTGISPGSGLGNRQTAVSEETVGFPVIAIGVPTVIDTATLIFDALDGLTEDFPKDLCKGEDFFVSLRDSDIVTNEVSSILSSAINRAFFAEGVGMV